MYKTVMYVSEIITHRSTLNKYLCGPLICMQSLNALLPYNTVSRNIKGNTYLRLGTTQFHGITFIKLIVLDCFTLLYFFCARFCSPTRLKGGCKFLNLRRKSLLKNLQCSMILDLAFLRERVRKIIVH